MTDEAPEVRLRPVSIDDVPVLLDKMTAQDGSDLNWSGFRSRASLVGRIEKDGYLSQEDGWLMVELDSGEVVGSVGWSAQEWARPPYSRAWSVGMALGDS